MSTDDRPDDRDDAHVFDETRDPADVLDNMTPDPIYKCGSCGTVWNGLHDENCPECPSTDRTHIADEYLIRAKWTIDGAETIDQAIEKFEYRAEQLKVLKEDGWEIQQQVSNDYAYLRRPVSESDD